MKFQSAKTFSLVITAVAVIFCASTAFSQEDPAPKKRLKSGVGAEGYIGGEAHDGYVIKAKKGQKMTVEISWKAEDDNRAEFSVSTSESFFDGELVNFGKESDQGKSWSGKIPKTDDYYIFVVAHPTANYTIKVRLQ